MVLSQLPTQLNTLFIILTPYTLSHISNYLFCFSFIIAPSLSLSSSPRLSPFIKMLFYFFSHSYSFVIYCPLYPSPFIKHHISNNLLSVYLEHACAYKNTKYKIQKRNMEFEEVTADSVFWVGRFSLLISSSERFSCLCKHQPQQ